MGDQAPLTGLAHYFESRNSPPTPTGSETPPPLLSNEAASFSTPGVNTTALWAPSISLRLTRIEDLLLKLSGTVSERDAENKELLRQNQQQQTELRTAVSDLNARITANDELLQGIQQQQKEQHTTAPANPTDNNQLLQQMHRQLLSAAADERDAKTKAEAAFNSKLSKIESNLATASSELIAQAQKLESLASGQQSLSEAAERQNASTIALVHRLQEETEKLPEMIEKHNRDIEDMVVTHRVLLRHDQEREAREARRIREQQEQERLIEGQRLREQLQRENQQRQAEIQLRHQGDIVSTRRVGGNGQEYASTRIQSPIAPPLATTRSWEELEEWVPLSDPFLQLPVPEQQEGPVTHTGEFILTAGSVVKKRRLATRGKKNGEGSW